MTRDEIIEMARQAGLCHDINNGIYLCAPKHLEAFAKLVAAKERVACFDAAYDAHATTAVLEAIRARGEA